MLCKVLIFKRLVRPTPGAVGVSRTSALRARRGSSVKVEEYARLPCGASAVVCRQTNAPVAFHASPRVPGYV